MTTGPQVYLQYAFRMLLKAVLVQTGKQAPDQATGCSIGFDSLHLASARQPDAAITVIRG